MGWPTEEQPGRLAELFAHQCSLVPFTFGNPDKEATDECAAPIERAVGDRVAALVLAGANDQRQGLRPLELDTGLSAAAHAKATAQADADD